jgi:hypothetical protein
MWLPVDVRDGSSFHPYDNVQPHHIKPELTLSQQKPYRLLHKQQHNCQRLHTQQIFTFSYPSPVGNPAAAAVEYTHTRTMKHHASKPSKLPLHPPATSYTATRAHTESAPATQVAPTQLPIFTLSSPSSTCSSIRMQQQP